MKKILRAVTAAFASVFLATGVLVGAQSGSIDTTGPDSDNEIRYENSYDYSVENSTDVEADVSIDQDAETGDAMTTRNTDAGDAETGDADNDSEVEASLDIDNSSSSECACTSGPVGDGDASIEKTGPDSNNSVVFENDTNIEINNDTDVNFNTDVEQNASSGDATVSRNTMGGSASTGGASNSSSVVFSLSVTN